MEVKRKLHYIMTRQNTVSYKFNSIGQGQKLNPISRCPSQLRSNECLYKPGIQHTFQVGMFLK